MTYEYLMFISFIIVLLFQNIHCAKRRTRPVVCKVSLHKYYLDQADQCFRCDKCWEGFGLVPSSEYELKMDLVHGALECLPCQKCKPGTYSDRRAYQCRICRNCTELGRIESKPCTEKSNAMCGDPIPNTREPRPQDMRVSQSRQVNESLDIIAVIPLSIISVIIIMSTVVVFLKKKKGNTNNSNVKSEATEEIKLLQLNNSYPQKSSGIPHKEALPTAEAVENEETRLKETVICIGKDTPNLTENTSELEPLQSTSTSVTLDNHPLCVRKKEPQSHCGMQYVQYPYSICYTNLACSRSMSYPPSFESTPHIPHESMKSLSEFSYVLN